MKRWKTGMVFLLLVVLLTINELTEGAYAQTIGNVGTQNVRQSEIFTDSESQLDQKSVRLLLDNENLYEGMDRSYSEGYVPRVQNGLVELVVPMVSTGPLQGDKLRVSLQLGDAQTGPFVIKNYEKTITLGSAEVNNGSKRVEGYVAAFSLELKSDRYNGSYPVIVTVQAEDTKGNEIRQDFTVYVTIIDGRNLNEEPTTEAVTEEPVIYGPKVMIESCHIRESEVISGKEITADITLVNTSQSMGIRNMMVTISAQGEYFTLLSDSNSIFVDAIAPGGSTVITYTYEINTATPQGQYDLNLVMDYADERGGSYSESGRAKVTVTQPVELQFDPLNIPNEVQVGDVIEVSLQAMNLGRGKVYQVRAELEADGLNPEGTLFIGDMEAGTTQQGRIRVTVSRLTEGNLLYGATEGTITFYYEDEAGHEYTETAGFATTIQSPFSNANAEEPDQPGQWWILMTIISVILVGMGVYVLIRRQNARRQREEVAENEMVE